MEEGSSIFTQYVNSRHSLVKDSKILQTTYIPDNLPHRKDKIDAIVEILAPALGDNKPSNILIFGKTGTGKTAVMTYIGKELKKADPNEDHVCFIYVNCEVNDTAYGIMYSISNQIVKDPTNNKIPFTGWSLDKILTALAEVIDNEYWIFAVVLDEIDRSFERNCDYIFYYLTSLIVVL